MCRFAAPRSVKVAASNAEPKKELPRSEMILQTDLHVGFVVLSRTLIGGCFVDYPKTIEP